MKLAGYQAIATAIREHIVSGGYVPGDKIPSIRQFAAAFQCNKLTVQRAFDLLKRENLIENRIGSGSFVRYPEKIASPAAVFDFRTDYLHPGLFPYGQIQALFNQLFEDQGGQALAPTPAEGDPGLIRVLSRHYQLPADRMMVISGAQQGLDLVAKVFRATLSGAMLFEDPTYPGAISLFRASHFVTLRKDGPDLDHLHEKLRAPIRLFYTMPTVHNPTGIAYSLEKKRAVSRLARKHDFFIIEDDCLSEFRRPRISRFIDLCPERTVYVKSLSQLTVSGIRLGLLVVPEGLFKKFLFAKFSSDIASFGMMQRCMREFIRQGSLLGHLSGIQTVIDHRRAQLTAAIESMGHLSVLPHQAGYSLWVRSDRRLSVDPVPWCRGEEFSFSPEMRQYARISFMHLQDDMFRSGVDYLVRVLDAAADGGSEGRASAG
jgi:2-aminoadipate transaminase